MRHAFAFGLVFTSSCFFVSFGFAQDSGANTSATVVLSTEQASRTTSTDDEDVKTKMTQEELFAKFTEDMKNVKLIGTFTVDGRGGKFMEEEYVITSVKKTDESNYWVINAKIKYGKIDVTVPLVLPVEWAGETPMISISDLKIPLVGSGSFGAKVIFSEGKYAGTWNHDKVGGHMFGRIEKNKEVKKEKKKRKQR
ncbi:hypothetical protein N8550_01870 [Pirellulaceae bacterium]|jgi:hypothetical protein|nr:hypothetical protein [Pirellulaceae bacterium]MDB4640459.1 hypothetical protein [Pirellulaceae bacterium]